MAKGQQPLIDHHTKLAHDFFHSKGIFNITELDLEWTGHRLLGQLVFGIKLFVLKLLVFTVESFKTTIS